MLRMIRWWARPAKHSQFLVSLETDPLFWGMLVAGTIAFVYGVVPFTLHRV